DLFPDHPEQASWRFELRDQHIPDVVLTKAQQIDILELDKADRLQLAPTALKNWVDLFEHWQEQHIMAQLTHTPVMTVLQSLEQMSQTKEERLRALARERAVWDYNTEIQAAEERGQEQGMQILLRTLIEARFGQPLPDWVLSRLRAATPEQLQQWGISLTQAQRLEDIFEV
ncbi:PD-(D/E)XK nuclease family transposase, partial [Aquaspirillum soli]